MTISDFRQTFVEAFQNWSFPPDELLSYRQLVNDHRPFLICITPRSGSTYLRDLLLQTRSAGRPHEFLNLDVVTSRLQKVNAVDGTSSISFLQYLHGVLELQTPRGGSCGITTSYYQFLPLIKTGLDRLLFQDFRIIRLLRRQLVEQAVSLYLAVETGIFHSGEGTVAQSNAGRDNVPYDAEKLRDWVRHLWFQELGWNDYCRSRRERAPTLFYEELQSTPRQVVSKILGFLEIDVNRPPRPGKSRVSKLGDELNVAWARDFVAEPENIAFLRDLGVPDERFFQPASDGGIGVGSG